jgi:hypothetical protein
LGTGERESSGLKRFQEAKSLHCVTFSCFRRLPLLEAPGARETVEAVLEETRARYQARVYAYVLMPEHVHPCAEISCPTECGSRKANDRPFPPKPQKARLGWGTFHRGRTRGEKWPDHQPFSILWNALIWD